MMIGMTPPAFSLETWPVGWRASDLNDELTRLTTQLSLVATPSTDGVLYANASQQLIDAAWHAAGFTQSSINADPAKRGKTYNRPSIAARNGVRQNSATRYLLPVRERVTIQTGAHTHSSHPPILGVPHALDHALTAPACSADRMVCRCRQTRP
jgi:hypothetical protein